MVYLTWCRRGEAEWVGKGVAADRVVGVVVGGWGGGGGRGQSNREVGVGDVETRG